MDLTDSILSVSFAPSAVITCTFSLGFVSSSFVSEEVFSDTNSSLSSTGDDCSAISSASTFSGSGGASFALVIAFNKTPTSPVIIMSCALVYSFI